MSRVIKFKAEVGWSELIASVAMTISLLSFMQSNKATSPHVTVTPLEPRVFSVCSEGELRRKTLALIPFQIINTGGRATALVGLHYGRRTQSLVGETPEHRYKAVGAVLVVPKKMDTTVDELADLIPEDLEARFSDGRSIMIGYEGTAPSLSVGFNRLLPTAEPVVLSLGFMSDSIEQIKRFILNLKFEFGHGQVVPVQIGFEVPGPDISDQCTSP